MPGNWPYEQRKDEDGNPYATACGGIPRHGCCTWNPLINSVGIVNNAANNVNYAPTDSSCIPAAINRPCARAWFYAIINCTPFGLVRVLYVFVLDRNVALSAPDSDVSRPTRYQTTDRGRTSIPISTSFDLRNFTSTTSRPERFYLASTLQSFKLDFTFVSSSLSLSLFV